MPRQGRIQSGTGVYHVMMRGINRQRIFEDSEDHYTFLQCLRSAQEQYTPLGDRLPNSCHYYAYALMSNHFHLLLHAKDDTVGNIVKRMDSVLTRVLVLRSMVPVPVPPTIYFGW